MALRLGVDLDGTLADLSSAYRKIEENLYGAPSAPAVDDGDDEVAPEQDRSDKERLRDARARTSRQDAVWRAIRHTPDFWTTLSPIEPGAVQHLYDSAVMHGWEVFFITQRPTSAGLTVQTQSQQWLIEQGFKTPSVLTLNGSRGKAAHALDLDFLIDDLARNCVDVVSDSKCRPILVLRRSDPDSIATAKLMKIGTVRSVAEAISLLSKPVPVSRKGAVGSVLRLLGLAK